MLWRRSKAAEELEDGRPSTGDLYATAWTCGCVLGEGEPLDSPRAVAQAGPRAAVMLHRAADFDMEGWQNTSPVPREVAAEVAGYVEMARHYEPPDARYLTNHRGHFLFVKPEERKFVTAELIRHHLHRYRASAQTAGRSLARRRLEPARHCNHSGRGTGTRRLGAH